MHKWILDKKSVGCRLKQLRKQINRSQAEFAENSPVSQSNIARIESGSLLPAVDLVSYLNVKLGVNPNWLLYGEGEMFLQSKRVSDSSNFQLVPVIGAATCGSSGRIAEKDIEGYKAFEISFIRKFKNPALTRAKGDSMMPTIADGDLLLCDRDPYKCQHPDPESIYLVNHPDSIDEVSIKVKKLILSKKTLTLIPLNPAFPPAAVDVTGKSILDIVLGQIVWIGRELI
jgi:SOS-response transcriptional repressor LexA